MYIKKTWKFKNSIEVEKSYTARFGKKGMKHNPKINSTPEAMMKHNRKRAVDNLRRLIKFNFENGFHLVLTYRKTARPDPVQAHKNVSNFLRRMKYHLDKMGVEFKYIAVTEYENVAIHHHLIINNVPGMIELINKQWKHGQANFTSIYENEDVQTLAEYLVKQTDKTFRNNPATRLRYTRSRNLIVPEPKVEIIRANEFRKTPSVPAGYTLDVDSLVQGVSSVTGYEYQKYTLKKIQSVKKRR